MKVVGTGLLYDQALLDEQALLDKQFDCRTYNAASEVESYKKYVAEKMKAHDERVRQDLLAEYKEDLIEKAKTALAYQSQVAQQLSEKFTLTVPGLQTFQFFNNTLEFSPNTSNEKFLQRLTLALFYRSIETRARGFTEDKTLLPKIMDAMWYKAVAGTDEGLAEELRLIQEEAKAVAGYLK